MRRLMKLLAFVFAVLFFVTALPTSTLAAQVSSYNCQYTGSKYGGGSKYFYVKANSKTCKLTFSCTKGVLDWDGIDVIKLPNAKVYGTYEIKIYKWDAKNNKITGKSLLPEHTDIWNTKSKTITFKAEKGCYYRVQVYFWRAKTTAESYWLRAVYVPLDGAAPGPTPYWVTLPKITAKNKANCTLYNSMP
ncbi:MAG: hypothetical protein Q4C01_07565 [Clostridia bacterium]|nr:hypothetical protein [Clostridia bacterium]